MDLAETQIGVRLPEPFLYFPQFLPLRKIHRGFSIFNCPRRFNGRLPTTICALMSGRVPLVWIFGATSKRFVRTHLNLQPKPPSIKAAEAAHRWVRDLRARGRAYSPANRVLAHGLGRIFRSSGHSIVRRWVRLLSIKSSGGLVLSSDTPPQFFADQAAHAKTRIERQCVFGPDQQIDSFRTNPIYRSPRGRPRRRLGWSPPSVQRSGYCWQRSQERRLGRSDFGMPRC